MTINLNSLLSTYDKFMLLKLYIDSIDANLRDMYVQSANNHNNKIIHNHQHIDAGFDLFAPIAQESRDDFSNDQDVLQFFGANREDENPVNKLNFRIKCSARMFTDTGKNYNTGYFMYPRSSLSRTRLRLANSTGIIDSGYRGHLIGMFDVVNIPNDEEKCADYLGEKYDRYLQICAPGLVPILIEIVNSIEELGQETERGSNGFGSTGR
jgi:dUTPase